MQINIKNTAGPVGAVTKCGNVRVRKTVFTVVLIIGVLVIFAAFISFIALSATAGSGGGNETMQYIFIPFAVFGACAVTMPFLFTMRAADRPRLRGDEDHRRLPAQGRGAPGI